MIAELPFNVTAGVPQDFTPQCGDRLHEIQHNALILEVLDFIFHDDVVVVEIAQHALLVAPLDRAFHDVIVKYEIEDFGSGP